MWEHIPQASPPPLVLFFTFLSNIKKIITLSTSCGGYWPLNSEFHFGQAGMPSLCRKRNHGFDLYSRRYSKTFGEATRKNSMRDFKPWGVVSISTGPAYLELFSNKYMGGNCESPSVSVENGGTLCQEHRLWGQTAWDCIPALPFNFSVRSFAGFWGPICKIGLIILLWTEGLCLLKMYILEPYLPVWLYLEVGPPRN